MSTDKNRNIQPSYIMSIKIRVTTLVLAFALSQLCIAQEITDNISKENENFRNAMKGFVKIVLLEKI